MEDVLEVYQRPYDPLRPVVCIDETNKQLIKETRMPCEPGRPEKVDSVYVRNGVADVFMISEPLAGRRETVVTQTRTALDFAFYAGNPSEELVKYKPESCKQDFIIMVPQNAGWAELIEKCYGDKAKKVTRYAIKKEMNIFDVKKLQQAIDSFQSGYVLKKMEETEYNMCKKNTWANDLVSQYKNYKDYKNLGLGIAVLKDGELVAGASSYSRYDKGIEIEIDTQEDHRRKGLAYACGAKLILECLEEGLYPSWDAQNKWSAALAEKLGYHFSHEYVAYEIMGY